MSERVGYRHKSELFQIYQAIQDELVRSGFNRERTAQRLVETGDNEDDLLRINMAGGPVSTK